MAPGVGKTYEMLEEGRRLRDEGHDVVIAIVETHGRVATAAQAEGLEVIPRRAVAHRGVALDEMDLDAVLERHPRIALVDELAHTNVPGSRNEKRWTDVEELLDAGIDVITTVNVQHIESLNDVVEKITGVVQRETVPDAVVVRSADQIEVVDLAPQSLRDRLAAGSVYPAERIDAALSNYFRLGNLTALRELALLWLADEVDSALQRYRTEHGIEGSWQARERVVVALTGGPEGETLLRRGARIAARSAGGELLAVHVSSQDGLRTSAPATLAEQRALVESLGGSYHQVVGDDPATALVDFARSVNASQLVIGVSRRGRLAAALTGPASVPRHPPLGRHRRAHRQPRARGRTLRPPRLSGPALSAKRRLLGFVVAVLGGPLISLLLISTGSDDSIAADVLVYQLLVVVVALIGGIWPALFAAVLSGFTLNFLFIEPLYTVTISNPANTIALVLYVVIAMLVSTVVDQAARRARSARRATAEAELLATVAGSVLRGESTVPALVTRAREAFGLAGVRLVAADGAVLATDGEPVRDGRSVSVPVGDGRATLELHGGDLDASERRLLDVVVAQLAAALERTDLAETAAEADALAETDQVRSALLSAVSHDLRRPLAAAVASLGGLRAAGDQLSDDDRRELLETADESLATLSVLVTDLLDVSRVQAGVLAVSLTPTDAAGVVLMALDELDLGPDDVSSPSTPTCPRSTPTRCCCSAFSSTCSPTPSGTHPTASVCASPRAASAAPPRSA